MKAAPPDLISESTHYEAYFDLWGFSPGWINTIVDALHDFTRTSEGDSGESYQNEACVAFRFTSTDPQRRERAKAVFRRLEPLARRTYTQAEETRYHLRCG